nr:hypothetical protein Iba_chr07eCG9950 [Ipomoea batatas]
MDRNVGGGGRGDELVPAGLLVAHDGAEQRLGVAGRRFGDAIRRFDGAKNIGEEYELRRLRDFLALDKARRREIRPKSFIFVELLRGKRDLQNSGWGVLSQMASDELIVCENESEEAA